MDLTIFTLSDLESLIHVCSGMCNIDAQNPIKFSQAITTCAVLRGLGLAVCMCVQAKCIALSCNCCGLCRLLEQLDGGGGLQQQGNEGISGDWS